ncbi:phytanoyl-CoA dioxygenase family protein [Bacteroidota bacterium]
MPEKPAVDISHAPAFDERGFSGPTRVLTDAECDAIWRAYKEETFPLPLDWTKGYAPTSRLFYDLASRSSIVDVVRELIGDDIMLWGVQMVVRPTGAVHSYHTDAETEDPNRKSVSVWVGIRNTSVQSSLRIIPYSHRFGCSLQKALVDSDLDRFNVAPDEVEELALTYEPRARIEQVDMSDGDALFFDGRLWHGSHNTRRSGVRFAALLQYARPDVPIRIPNLKDHSVPQKFFDHPRPPCIMVHGSDIGGVNRFVTSPLDESARLPVMTSWIRDLELPLHPDELRDFQAFPKARGSSATLSSLTCHVSALSPGKSPHTPHEHNDEELLITLSGELDILDEDGSPIHRTRAGTVLYYPAHFKHTVLNSCSDVANYVMFKWTRQHDGGTYSATSDLYAFGSGDSQQDSVSRTRLIDRQTAYLKRLRCHLTTMPQGVGYEPHVDAYDVGILTLAGTIETLGESVGPGSVIFYAAGQPHGIRSIGSEAARYLVFEFHGGDSPILARPKHGARAAAKRARRQFGAFLADHPGLRRLLGR